MILGLWAKHFSCYLQCLRHARARSHAPARWRALFEMVETAAFGQGLAAKAKGEDGNLTRPWSQPEIDGLSKTLRNPLPGSWIPQVWCHRSEILLELARC